MCFGFDGLEMNDHARSMIDAGCGAVIIFARNIATPAQVASLTAAMKRRAAPRPLLVMVDQEGGRVARFRAPRFTDIPSARRVGRSPDPVRAATVVGDVVARELRATGVDMTLAPVVDVDTNPECVVIGDRAFATEPDAVGDAAVAFIEAAQKAGAATCAKHWPGHGDVREDSHDALPVLPHALDRLRAVEMRPFERAVEANVAAVLVAHLEVPAMEPDPEEEETKTSGGGDGDGTGSTKSRPLTTPPRPPRPASCSRAVVGYLREVLGYDGLVMTDDMEMGALRSLGVGECAVRGLLAGVDLFLACHARRAQEAVIDALAIAIDGARRDASEAAARATARIDACCDAFVAEAGLGGAENGLGDVGTARSRDRIAEALGAAAAGARL